MSGVFPIQYVVLGQLQTLKILITENKIYRITTINLGLLQMLELLQRNTDGRHHCLQKYIEDTSRC